MTYEGESNINAKNKPCSSALYELCDIYGVYIDLADAILRLSELDGLARRISLDFVPPGENPKKNGCLLLLDGANSVITDRNHSSVLIWS